MSESAISSADSTTVPSSLPLSFTVASVVSWLAAASVWIAAIVLFATAVVHTQVNGDGGYYLGSARSILAGAAPYRDLELWYPPLTFFLYGIPLSLGGGPVNPSPIFLFEYLFYLGAAGFLYLLSGRITGSLPVRLLTSGAFVLLALTFEGNYIVLEPYLVFFALGSVAFAFRSERWAPLVSGALFGLGILCKHYGLYVGPVVVVGLFVSHPRARVRACVEFGVAAGAVIAIAILLLITVFGSTAAGLRQGFFPVQYLAIKYDRGPVFTPLAKHLPLVFLAPLLFFFRRARTNVMVIASFVGFLCGATFLVVRQWEHYFILFFPFALLLCAAILEEARARSRVAMVVFTATFGTMVWFGWKKTDELGKSTFRESQITTCRNLSAVTAIERPMFLIGNPALEFTCRFDPPLEGRGYLFAESYSRDALYELLPKQKLVLVNVISPGVLVPKFSALFEREPGELFTALRRAGFVMKGQVGELEVWERG